MKSKSITYSIFASILLCTNSGAVETFASTMNFTLRGINTTWGGNGNYQVLPTGDSIVSVGIMIELYTATQQIRVLGSSLATTFHTMNSSSMSQLVDYIPGTPGTPAIFPNPPTPPTPPQYIYDSGSLTLMTNTQVPAFSFDSGLQTYFWDGSNYAFYGPQISFFAPMTIESTLLTGGESNFNSYSFIETFESAGGNWKIVANDYPNSLSVITSLAIRPYGNQIYSDYRAPNGFEANLFIPEPSAALLCFLSSSTIFRRKRR
jgi:hypothetical protein